MAINFDPINHLRPGAIRLQPWKSEMAPQASTNVLHKIVNFARYHGLPEIPAATVERLRTDPDFKYCFSVGMEQNMLYSASDFWKFDRDQMMKGILDPSSITAREIVTGMRMFFNNFLAYLPGGVYRGLIRTHGAKFFPKQKVIIRQMNELIKEMGVGNKLRCLTRAVKKEEASDIFSADRAEELKKDPIAFYNNQYAKRLAYLKLCLEIFNRLIEKHGHSADELWK